jgi:hypothetical protein
MRNVSAQPKHLATYLNDHLAASVTAVKLLSRLQKAERNASLSRFAADMRREVQQDQRQLQSLMGRLGVKQSRTRKATGWFAEKLTELKLKVDDPHADGFSTLEILEIVELGIEGKRALWQALAAASEDEPALRGADYQQLTQRAQDQHTKMETIRLATAHNVLAA